MLKDGVVLADKTSFHIGGPADYFAEVENCDELREVLWMAKKKNIPFWILGKGTNVLIADEGFRGVVIVLKGEFKNVDIRETDVHAGAAVGFPTLSRKVAKYSLSGLEFAVGIPGTLAGAIAMNAGAGDSDIGHWIRKVTYMSRKGEIKTLPMESLDFQYRSSRFQAGDDVICSCDLKLESGNDVSIQEKMKSHEAYRKKTQPLQFRNAGCVFKNPPGESAGRMIDAAGLKGIQVGDAEVSETHANFIVNRGNARAADVVQLIRIVRKKILVQFDTYLQLEIKTLGFKEKI